MLSQADWLARCEAARRDGQRIAVVAGTFDGANEGVQALVNFISFAGVIVAAIVLKDDPLGQPIRYHIERRGGYVARLLAVDCVCAATCAEAEDLRAGLLPDLFIHVARA